MMYMYMKQRKASNCTKVNIKQHTIKAFSLTFHLFITSCLKSFAFSCFFFCCCFSVCMVDWIIFLVWGCLMMSWVGRGWCWGVEFTAFMALYLVIYKLKNCPDCQLQVVTRHRLKTSDIKKHLAYFYVSDSCFVVRLDAIYWPPGQIWWWPVDAETLAASHSLDASFICFCLGSWCKLPNIYCP